MGTFFTYTSSVLAKSRSLLPAASPSSGRVHSLRSSILGPGPTASSSEGGCPGGDETGSGGGTVEAREGLLDTAPDGWLEALEGWLEAREGWLEGWLEVRDEEGLCREEYSKELNSSTS